FSFITSGVTCLTSSTSPIRLINEIIANNKPTGTATVRLTNKVNRKVVANTRESLDFNFKMCMKDLYSLMLNATTIKIGAMLANGILDAYGANNNKIANTKTLCKIPENGLTAPALILVAVRAMAPVAGIPPNIGVTMLASP